MGCVRKAVMEMKEKGKQGEEVNVLKVFNSMAEDIIGELCFGESFKTEGNGEVSSRHAFIPRSLLMKGADFVTR